MEENLREIQEYGFCLLFIGDRSLRVGGKVCDTHKRSADGAQHGQYHPAHADAASGFRILGGAKRHETHDNMRLTEVSQTPGKRRGDTDNRGSSKEIECIGLGVRDSINNGVSTAHIGHGDDRHGNQCSNHQQALHHIGVGCSHEPAEESVEHGDTGDEKHTGEVVLVEGRLEEFTAGDHAGRDVEGEEDEDNNARNDSQQVLFIVQSVTEEHGDGHGIASDFGVAAQTGRNHLPVDPCSNCQTDSHPRIGFREPRKINNPGQTHQEPAGHICGACRESRDGGGELSSSKHIVVKVVIFTVCPQTNHNHGDKVNRQCDDLERTVGHLSFLSSGWDSVT